MMRHGGSHAFCVLVCTLASGFLLAMLRAYLPELLYFISQSSVFVCDLADLPYPPKYVELIIVATVAALIWGVAFSFLHKDKK